MEAKNVDPLKEVSEAMTIKVKDESGEEIDAPLLDVQTVIKQHLREYPVLLSSRDAIVLKSLAYRKFQQIRQKHKSWLRQNENDLVEYQRLIEKKDAGETLTEEEQKSINESAIDSFPYTSELIHAMIVKPTMTIDEFQTLIREVWTPQDWIVIQKTAMKVLQETYIRINPKN